MVWDQVNTSNLYIIIIVIIVVYERDSRCENISQCHVRALELIAEY